MMKKKINFSAISFFIVAITIVIFTTCKKAPVEIYGHINGTVFEEGTTTPIQGVTIILSPIGTTKTTGSDGKYEFKNLEAKEYTLQASKSAYTDNTKNVKVTVGEDTKLDISLAVFIPFITPSFVQHSPTAEAGNIVLNIESNINWNASSNASSWLTIVPQTGSNNGSVTISWTDNTSSQNRVGILTFSGTGANNQTVTITQAAAGSNLSISPASKNVSANSGNFSIELISNISWSVSSDENWLTLNAMNGSGDANLTATYEANEFVNQRTATLSFSGMGVGSQTVTLTQEGATAYISISPTNQNVNSETGEFTFTVSSNANWTINDNVDWLSISPTSGTGNGSVVASYENNTAQSSRSATITLSATGLSPATSTLTQTAASYYINVTSPTSSDDWLMNSQQEITWEDNIDENVRIELLTDGNLVETISSSTLSDGVYEWTTPTAYSQNFNYQIRVTNTSNSSISGISEFFNFSINIPKVNTGNISNVEYVTATCGGEVTSNGGDAVIERGVCWSIAQSPTVSDSKTVNGSGLGTFTSNLTGFTENITYYLRAYATNNEGTAYGSQISFTTIDFPDDLDVTDVDGNVYAAVLIGNQIWMAEDLRVTHFPNGNAIQNVTDNTDWENLPSYYALAYCFYNNDNTTDYGALYTWKAAMDGASSSNLNPSGVQGVCPDGWHLPSDAEWWELISYLGGLDVAGGKIRETGTSHWSGSSEAATNESGFTALPGGRRNYDGGFFASMGAYAYWWTTNDTSTPPNYSFLYSVKYDNTIIRSISHTSTGYSVRCVQD